MIDIHSHILPGVDDGASSLEEAIEMVMMSQESGVRKLVLTPHSNQSQRFKNYYPDIKEKFDAFVKIVHSLHIDIDLVLGMEIFGSENICDHIKEGKLIGLNQTNYFLIEFPFHVTSTYITQCVKQVRKFDIVPIIAHPERYDCVINNPGCVIDWIRSECKLQVNKGSLFGSFGNRIRKAAHVLLENRWIDYVASDAHGIEYRTPSLEAIKDYLEIYYGIDYAEDVLYKNASMIFQ